MIGRPDDSGSNPKDDTPVSSMEPNAKECVDLESSSLSNGKKQILSPNAPAQYVKKKEKSSDRLVLGSTSTLTNSDGLTKLSTEPGNVFLSRHRLILQ